jgi:hypothetical protein
MSQWRGGLGRDGEFKVQGWNRKPKNSNTNDEPQISWKHLSFEKLGIPRDYGPPSLLKLSIENSVLR